MQTTTPPLDLQALERLREQELEEARAIQSVMLPGGPLEAGSVIISHEFQPMAAVGGDFLDYFELPNGHVGLYLGDVSGKGLPAALYAALAVGTLRGVHKTGTSTHEVLAMLNRRLVVRGIPQRYTTVQYAVFDPQTREMHLASAGMAGPFHLSRGGCRILRLSGIPPGLFPATNYENTTIRLAPGDSVLFCTDGLTDATNGCGEQFGIENLEALCKKNRFAPPSQFLQNVFATLESFTRGCEQQDDMTAALFHLAE
jgi:phosphoserine phosphatase RsbU/P